MAEPAMSIEEPLPPKKPATKLPPPEAPKEPEDDIEM